MELGKEIFCLILCFYLKRREKPLAKNGKRKMLLQSCVKQVGKLLSGVAGSLGAARSSLQY